MVFKNLTVNERHKVGLFFTVISAGLCLVFGTSLSATMGVVLLGLALTWAFGSDNRLLRLCFLVIGLLLLFYPLGANLVEQFNARREYKEKLASFESQLPELAAKHPDLSAGLVPPKPIPPPPPGFVVVPAQRTVTIPNVGDIQFPVTMSSEDIAKAIRNNKDKPQPPQWFFDALHAGVDAAEINGLDNPGWTVVPPRIFEAIKDGWAAETIGLVLTTLFLGSFIADIRKRRGR